MFRLQELSPGTKNLLRNSVPLSAFAPEGPGSKLSSREIVLPPKKSLLGGVVLSKSTGTLRAGFARMTVTDWSNTGTAAALTCVLLHS